MSKCLSAKYYQENKEILQKIPWKDIKIFLMKKKIFQNMKDKSLLSIEKKL